MRKLFVINNNPLFQGMWSFQKELARKWGYKADLWYIYDQDEGPLPSVAALTPHRWGVRFKEGVNPRRDWRVPSMLLWLAAQYPNDEVIMFSGLDQYQLAPQPYKASPEPLDSVEVRIPLAGGYPEIRGRSGFTYYPSGLLSAKAGTFLDLLGMMGSLPVHSADSYLSHLWHNRDEWPAMFPGDDYWGLDEAYLSWAIHASGKTVWAPRELFGEFSNHRLDRAAGRMPLRPSELREGKWWELHGDRPISGQDQLIINAAIHF